MAPFLLRSYQPGDEEQTAARYNRAASHFVGPFEAAPEQWLSQFSRSWRGPMLDEDPECVRVAEREGRIIGHACTNYQGDYAQVLELCVEEGLEAEAIAQALLEDVEARARERGTLIVLLSAPEEGPAWSVAQAAGYHRRPALAVFQTVITDLEQFLREIQPELVRRLGESEWRGWRGTIALRSGELHAGLRLEAGQVEVAPAGRADLAATIEPESLSLLLLGRVAVGQLYLQDRLDVEAEDRLAALQLLDVLFPRVPIYLPPGQWW